VNFDQLFAQSMEAAARQAQQGTVNVSIAVNTVRSMSRQRRLPSPITGNRSAGTALAIQFARAARPRLWGRNAAHLRQLAEARENRRYLPGGDFPSGLTVF
jgi:hypothetical protein